MIDVQMVPVPILTVGAEPAFGNGADEAAAGRQVEVLGRGVLLG